MRHLKCRKCQHEWDGWESQPCAWCGADEPNILEEKTALTRYCEALAKLPRRKGETLKSWDSRLAKFMAKTGLLRDEGVQKVVTEVATLHRGLVERLKRRIKGDTIH